MNYTPEPTPTSWNIIRHLVDGVSSDMIVEISTFQHRPIALNIIPEDLVKIWEIISQDKQQTIHDVPETVETSHDICQRLSPD